MKFREPTKLHRKSGDGRGEGSDWVGAWDRIETTPAEGIATQQTPQGERGAVKDSVAAHGNYSIFRAGGLEAAGTGNSAHRM
jgi:hypothetical protein